MNLDDLRAQLQKQATEIDPTAPAPLAAIRRRRTFLKRRRAGALVAGVAAVAAIAIAVLPGVINTSTPDPATPPPDVTREGITIPGTEGVAWLEKAEIGKPGQNPLSFSWTPRSDSTLFIPYCATTADDAMYVDVVVNGRVLVRKTCDNAGGSLGDGDYISPDDVLWTEAPPGKVAEVQVIVADQVTGKQGDPLAQVALGIYRSPTAANPLGLPGTPPGDPNDYVKDGVRFRQKIAGDTLLAATVGDIGQRDLKLRFTATSASTGLRVFCTANRRGLRYRLAIQIDAGAASYVDCSSSRSDVSKETGKPIPVQASPGQSVEVSVVMHNNVQPATEPGSRIGVGAYDLEPPRIVKDSAGQTASVAQTVDWDGRKYKLADLKSGNAASRQLSIATPGGRPFLLDYSSTELGIPIAEAKVTGLPRSTALVLSPDGDYGLAIGIDNGRYISPAAAPGTATLKLTKGKPTKGMLILALYVPE